MEPLEFGDLLMRRRPRLQTLATWLVEDDRDVGAAVRKALADTWRARQLLVSEAEMDAFLYTHFRSALRLRSAEPQ
jgi:DNA-directed RNA polymerase specialized sigma24 family protein